ncbi:hypothetical protein E4T56_gene15968 [Termitomyces sp. T112]|nr:hypothetical protein E4T56_gene15968 [Termitomyces sp. T112]KAH0587029.1 hypothetical protein H2248_005849 [Termitomyces sp. 'cryptogamus']
MNSSISALSIPSESPGYYEFYLKEFEASPSRLGHSDASAREGEMNRSSDEENSFEPGDMGDGMDPEGSSRLAEKTVKLLTWKALEEFKKI